MESDVLAKSWAVPFLWRNLFVLDYWEREKRPCDEVRTINNDFYSNENY